MRTRVIVIAVVVFAGLGLLSIAGGYAVLRGIDLNAYRPLVIERVKALTGRELRLDGELGFGLQDGFLIRADSLALGNARWGSRPQMLQVGHAEAHLALLPLLRGEVRVTRVELYDVDLILERDASGVGNWALFPLSAGDAYPSGGLPAISIESGQVAWHLFTGADAAPWIFTDLQLHAGLLGDRLHLEGDAKLGGKKLRLKGELPTQSVLASGSAEPFDLQMQFDDMVIHGKGMLQQAAWGLAPKLHLDIEDIDLAHVGQLTGRALPAMPPFSLTLDLARSPDFWRVTGLELKTGNSMLTGAFEFEPGTVRPKLTGHLKASRMDLTELFTLPMGQRQVSAPAPWDTWLRALNAFDAALELRISRIITWDVDLLDLQIDGQLTDGHLQLRPIKTDLANGGNAAGQFALNTGADRLDWSLTLRVNDLPTGALPGLKRATLIEAPLHLDLTLKTTGQTVRDAIANLGGDARLVIGKGHARIKSIDSLVGGLSTLTGQLLARNSEEARLNCAVADFVIEQGVATAEVLLIDSAVSTVRGDGRIDLVAGQFDLTFSPRAKTPTLNVAVPVHVRGPLRQPQFTADRVATLSKLIGVAGLFVYPPAAVVALGDLGGSGNACIKLMRGAKAPDEASSAPGKVMRGIGDAVQGIGSGVKKLLGQ